MNTITNLQEKFGSTDLDHLLDAYGDVDIPVITGEPQHQGDLFVFPMREGKVEGLVQVPAEGVAVIRGDAGGNTHLLLADGPVFFAPSNDLLRLGTLVVPEGSVAHLHHPEHGYHSIGTGTYVMKGQRTQMDEIRRVAD